MKRFNLYLLIMLLLVVTGLCACSSKTGDYDFDYNQHPAVTLKIEKEQDLRTNYNQVNEYFRDTYYADESDVSKDDDVMFCTYDEINRGSKDYEIFYSYKGIFAYVYDNDELVGTFYGDLNKSFTFIDITQYDNSYYLLAQDQDNYYILPFIDGELMELINIGNKYDFDSLFGDSKNNLYVSSAECIIQLDNNYEQQSSYLFTSPIVGRNVYDDKFYCIESSYDFDEDKMIASRQLHLKTVSLPKFNVDDVALLNCEINYIANDPEIDMLVSDSDVLFVLDTGVFCYSLKDHSIEMKVNTIDYGFENIRLKSYSDDKLELNVEYLDLYDNYNMAIAEITKSDSLEEKAVINVGMFGLSDYDRFFAEINRHSSDYYICINIFNLSNGNTDEKIDLLSGKHDLDMIVFEQTDYDLLKNSGCLQNLNQYDMADIDWIDPIDNIYNSGSDIYGVCLSYDLNLFAYNSALFGDKDITPDTSSNAQNLIGNQSVNKLISTFYGVIDKEIRETGKVSPDTTESLITLCDKYYRNGLLADSMLEEIREGEILFNNLEINSIEQFYAVCCYYGMDMGVMAPWGYDSIRMVPDSYVGIATTSKNSDRCVEIIEMLLSEDIQKCLGLPVNQKVFEDKLNNIYDYSNEEIKEIICSNKLVSAYEEEQFVYQLEQFVIQRENGEPFVDTFTYVDNDRLLKEMGDIDSREFRTMVIDTLKYSLYNSEMSLNRDSVIVNILVEEVNEYFDMNKGMESVSQSASNRINTYLAEIK